MHASWDSGWQCHQHKRILDMYGQLDDRGQEPRCIIRQEQPGVELQRGGREQATAECHGQSDRVGLRQASLYKGVQPMRRRHDGDVSR